ncbi:MULTISPECIES: membrane protein insertion efficiency factor YidD [Trichocoleus]|uniref:Membrane protein insertion efficiency factor YidD n=1 Tax=Trichocoleus desertorum GB2-A4 TaxID=2933944 RepID=A0ABV0J5F1_9CYAN|nr:membrane protein insertion efficiency factor YidD [Trichocoleus sp. FACHB-46]MBD1863833.1 membrane protein insertion efficiency factor YidD [Trichocoleus sp. FACHB-46]
METSIPDLWLRQAAASAIAGYQKHLSPRKGFSCAHRVLHGGESCSQYVKRVILEQGLWTAIPATRSRFAECKVANQILQARRNHCRLQAASKIEQEGEEKRRDRSSQPQNDCYGVDGLLSCIDCADCMNFKWGEQANCADLDCGSGLDCSSCDCSGGDCGSGDCGSCS